MSPTHELTLDVGRASAWLRAALVMLLLLAFCCSASAQEPFALQLNLPAFRLDVLADAEVIRSYPVAVGAPRYATPVGRFEISRVVWNPWWYPPASEWARKETITPPGPNNPMGKVKLLMGGPYYVHGTPWPLSLGHAASHGCIRMLNEDAIDVARRVQLASGTTLSSLATDSLAGPLYDTREVELPRPVPIRIVYELAEMRGDTLMIHPDVYRLGRGAARFHTLAALARAGFDTAAVDRSVLRQLLARAARRTQVISAERLFPLASDPSSQRQP